MKHIKLTCCLPLIFLLISCTSKPFIPLYPENTVPTSAASLVMPIQIDLVYHNGQQKSFTPPYRPLVNYQLLPGKHLIGLRYQNIHHDEEENQEIITSNIVIIQFTAKAQETYHIDFQKPENYAAAKQVESNFQLTLLNKQHVIASSTPATERIQKSDFLSFDETAHPPISSLPFSQKISIEQLKQWWAHQATQEERVDFFRWVRERENQTNNVF